MLLILEFISLLVYWYV